MNEKIFKELMAEREALADKLITAQRAGSTDEAIASFHEVCKEVAMHFLRSLQEVMNPTPEPIAFLAIFALRHFAKMMAEHAQGAQAAADLFAEIADVNSITIKFPRILKKEDDE